jgi:hypothetical protein
MPVPAVYAQSEENMNVLVTVPPRPVDFQFTIDATPKDSTVKQDTEILYTITYGSLHNADTAPFVIVATMQPGHIQDTPSSSLYITDYIIGSATETYDHVAPIVDLVNHTITWTIPTLPAYTKDLSVTFRTKTNNAYTGSRPVTFEVTAGATTPNLILNQSLTETYTYYQAPSIATATPTPTPKPLSLTLNRVNIQTISQSTVTVSFATSLPSSAFLTYGTSPGALTKTITDTIVSRYHLMTMSGLTPDTTYYFVITIKGTDGTIVRSERYTLHTASVSKPTTIDRQSLIITSQGTILQSAQDNGSSSSAVLTLPKDTEYEFQIRVSNPDIVKLAQAILRSSDVLGVHIGDLFGEAFAKDSQASAESVDMVEISRGLYIGKLKTKSQTGIYDMVTRITDIHGNISEETIGEIRVIQPLTVFWKNTKDPIEDVRIFLSRYNPRTDTYIPLSPLFSATRNPTFTGSKGESSFVLPNGRYQALVSRLGSEKTVYFTIGIDGASGYPVIYLAQTPMNIAGLLSYYTRSFLDVFLFQTMTYINILSNSLRFFDIIAAISLTFLVILTLFSFASRTLITVSAIPAYLVHLVHRSLKTLKQPRYLSGNVCDGETKRPLSAVDVIITDTTTHTVIACLQTDRSGHYFIPITEDATYQIQVMKKGYELLEPVSYKPDISPAHLIHHMYINHMHKTNVFHAISRIAHTIFGLFFELLLGMSVIFELLFLEYFGLPKTLPYLAASLLNIFLWILYLYHSQHHPPNNGHDTP